MDILLKKRHNCDDRIQNRVSISSYFVVHINEDLLFLKTQGTASVQAINCWP